MKFEEKFEPIVRTTDNQLVSLGLYDSYEEASDRAIVYASKDLPDECVMAFQIVKCYVNTNVPLNFTAQ